MLLNVGADHFAVCHSCGVFWPAGTGGLGAGRKEKPRVSRRNRETLRNYAEVEPVIECEVVA